MTITSQLLDILMVLRSKGKGEKEGGGAMEWVWRTHIRPFDPIRPTNLHFVLLPPRRSIHIKRTTTPRGEKQIMPASPLERERRLLRLRGLGLKCNLSCLIHTPSQAGRGRHVDLKKIPPERPKVHDEPPVDVGKIAIDGIESVAAARFDACAAQVGPRIHIC